MGNESPKSMKKRIEEQISQAHKVEILYDRRLAFEKAVDEFYKADDLSKDEMIARMNELAGKKRMLELFMAPTIVGVLMAYVSSMIQLFIDTENWNLILVLLASGVVITIVIAGIVAYGRANKVLWLKADEWEYELKAINKRIEKEIKKDKKRVQVKKKSGK